ncbi:TRAP transporter small permease [Anoxynatronum sibiricum]|uniref:TRAP transporter small permease n=1 Tax=Anoxynatronum sibiricum TaxID=210623 RepID=A0ABU9VRC3_9CLOT
MHALKKIVDSMVEKFCIFLYAGLVVLVTWQVFTRFVLNDPSVISEELAKVCFVWLVLFGAAYVFGERGHMAIEFIRDKFPVKLKLSLSIFIELVILGFSMAILVIGGYKVTMMTMGQSSAALRVPVGYIYAALPLSGSLIVFYTLNNIVNLFQKRVAIE